MQLELKISAEKVGKSCTNPDLKKQRVKSRRSGRCVLYVLNVISWIAVVKLYRNTNWTVILVWLTWQLKEVCIPSIYIVCINFHLLELAQVTMWTFVKTNIFTPPLKVLQRQPTSNELYYLWTVLLLDLLDFGTMIVLWLWDFFFDFPYTGNLFGSQFWLWVSSDQEVVCCKEENTLLMRFLVESNILLI